MKDLIHTITEKAKRKTPFIVGISGIDGSGKGYIASKLAKAIVKSDIRCELIGIDGWLQPPQIRFSQKNPGEHFYHYGFRFDEMLESLFIPLKENNFIDLWVKHSDSTNSSAMTEFHYFFSDVEVLIFEGIFLFQNRFDFDYKIWVECSYETALQRALQRNQESLTKKEIIRDYNEIYFPAQRFHLSVDKPRQTCDYILLNDELEKNEWP